MLPNDEMLVFEVSLGLRQMYFVERRYLHYGRSSFRREFDMKNHLFKLTSILCIALAVAFIAPQRAVADDDDDPPSRVARLSYAGGTVSFNPAGTDDWVSAVVNRPMTTGDKLWA